MNTQDTTRFDSEDTDLRADIRRMGDMLGETLRALWGQELFELVEYVPVYRTPAATGGGWGFARWQ